MPRLRSTEESKWIEPKLVLSWREERKAQTKFLNETSSLAVFHSMFLRVEFAPQNLNGATRMTQGSLATCYFLFWATKITISRSFFLSLLKWNRCTKTKFDYAAVARGICMKVVSENLISISPFPSLLESIRCRREFFSAYFVSFALDKVRLSYCVACSWL